MCSLGSVPSGWTPVWSIHWRMAPAARCVRSSNQSWQQRTPPGLMRGQSHARAASVGSNWSRSRNEGEPDVVGDFLQDFGDPAFPDADVFVVAHEVAEEPGVADAQGALAELAVALGGDVTG